MLVISLILFLLLLLVILAFFLIFSRNLFHCMIILSVFSFLITVIYCFLGAPDVAITEAAVGSAMSTIFFLLALKFRGSTQIEQNFSKSMIFLTILLIFSGTVSTMRGSIYMAENFGSETMATQGKVKEYYIQKTKEKLQFPNIVAAILASFRGFDTMLETTVIMTAAIAVMQILQINKIK